MIEIKLTREMIHQGQLVLVNHLYPLNNYQINLKRYDDNHLIDNNVFESLNKIFCDLNNEEDIILVSGYRNSLYQEQIYHESIKDNGIEYTKKYVALPNHSEHQTGLAIDLAKNDENIDFIAPEFPNYGIFKQFNRLASEYGFIKRYQKNKEEITKIAEEVWHFRYVGYPHAKIIYQNNFCLEEYHDYLKQYSYKKPLIFIDSSTEYHIFYISENDFDRKISIYETYELSGNNVDGVIFNVKKPLT